MTARGSGAHGLRVKIEPQVVPVRAVVRERHQNRPPGVVAHGARDAQNRRARLDREGGAGSLRKMVAECRAAQSLGRQILIFTEGTRVAPGERATIHPGVVALARGLKLPVIPASTDSGRYWGKHAFKKYPGTLHVTIYPAAGETAERRDLIQQLQERYYGDPVDNPVR